jgi:hypothetical protein
MKRSIYSSLSAQEDRLTIVEIVTGVGENATRSIDGVALFDFDSFVIRAVLKLD